MPASADQIARLGDEQSDHQGETSALQEAMSDATTQYQTPSYAYHDQAPLPARTTRRTS